MMRPSRGQGGFSLLELMVVLAIAGLLVALALPAGARLYERMQAREALRETLAVFAMARREALASGETQDVMVQPSTRRLWTAGTASQLPGTVVLTAHGAAELNRSDTGVIRFYPDGGASGGGIDMRYPDGSGTRINVDWLLGRVTHKPLGSG